jgi:hypothetical protein
MFPLFLMKIEALYRESLLELEMIHKQEEMEQLELEQALALSLLAEEERLRRARVEAKNSSADDTREVRPRAIASPTHSFDAYSR